MSDWDFFIQSLRVALKVTGIMLAVIFVVGGLFWCALKGK